MRDKKITRSIVYPELFWVELGDPGYLPRTQYNAEDSTATIYFQAKDKASPGLIATSRYAKSFFKNVIPNDASSVPMVVECLQEVDCPVLNIAGSRLSSFGEWVPQTLVNVWVYNYLEKIAREVRDLTIISGGQTGADWAGIVSAVKLELSVVANFPKDFRQERHNGVNQFNTTYQLDERLHDELIFMNRLL
jgi:hypothetical protein